MINYSVIIAKVTDIANEFPIGGMKLLRNNKWNYWNSGKFCFKHIELKTVLDITKRRLVSLKPRMINDLKSAQNLYDNKNYQNSTETKFDKVLMN